MNTRVRHCFCTQSNDLVSSSDKLHSSAWYIDNWSCPLPSVFLIILFRSMTYSLQPNWETAKGLQVVVLNEDRLKLPTFFFHHKNGGGGTDWHWLLQVGHSQLSHATVTSTYWKEGGRLSPMPPTRSVGMWTSPDWDCVSDALLSAGTSWNTPSSKRMLTSPTLATTLLYFY